MASSAVLGCVLAALLEDYDIYDEHTLATLIVDGDVAADIARRLRHDDFAAKLCAAKADLALTDKNGNTALALAEKNQHAACVQALQDKAASWF